jgi:hypothetical protein
MSAARGPTSSIKRRYFRFLEALALAVVVVPAPAAAYLDPGSASILWQVLVSAFLGMAFALRIFWTKLKNVTARLFGRGIREPSPPSTPPDEDR